MASKFMFEPQRYSAIAAATDLLGCNVAQGIAWGELDGHAGHPVYALGGVAEFGLETPAALGSPWFRNLAELDVFCLSHIEDYARVAERAERSGMLPDRWFWQAPALR